MVAYSDLGGLGSKQGAAVVYDWKPPSLVPAFLPWLAILALLGLKSNRCASAWWIWVPLLCVSGELLLPQSLLDFLPNSQLEVFEQWIGALGFGLAAVWLLAGCLGWKHRLLAFLGILAAQQVFGALTLVFEHELEADTWLILMPLAFTSLVIPVALSLAGLLCRRRYGWLRLSLWLIAALAVVWALVLTPFFIYARVMSGGRVPLLAFFGVEWVALMVTCGVLLPFLVLGFVNGFYRERLKGLFHLEAGAAAPPVVAPPPPAVAEPAAG